METSNQEQLKEEFMQLTQDVPQDVWWNWVKGWFSKEFIVDTYNNWEDEDTLKEEIEKLKNLQEEYNNSVELTILTKEDILSLYQDYDNIDTQEQEKIIKIVDELNVSDLKEIASEMTEYFCDSGSYWSALRDTFEERYLKNDN